MGTVNKSEEDNTRALFYQKKRGKGLGDLKCHKLEVLLHGVTCTVIDHND
jgi:hypothetical protein